MVKVNSLLALAAALTTVVSAFPTPIDSGNNLSQENPDTSTTTSSHHNGDSILDRRGKPKSTTTVYASYPTLPAESEIIEKFTVPWTDVSLPAPAPLQSIEPIVKAAADPSMHVSLWSDSHNLKSIEIDIPPTPMLPFPKDFKDAKSWKEEYKEALKNLRLYMHPEVADSNPDLSADRIVYSNKLRSWVADIWCEQTEVSKEVCANNIRTFVNRRYSNKEFANLRDFPRLGASILLGVDLVNFIGPMLLDPTYQNHVKGGIKEFEDLDSLIFEDLGYKGEDFFFNGVWTGNAPQKRDFVEEKDTAEATANEGDNSAGTAETSATTSKEEKKDCWKNLNWFQKLCGRITLAIGGQYMDSDDCVIKVIGQSRKDLGNEDLTISLPLNEENNNTSTPSKKSATSPLPASSIEERACDPPEKN